MKMKKAISLIGALCICVTSMPSAITASADSETSPTDANELNKKFTLKDADPSKVMWTTTMVEDVDEDYGNVNPNASNKDDSGHQSPYADAGTNLTSWAYAEYLWTHSYPIGNGRMAGMVAGGIEKEIIQINEDTIWDGSPYGKIVTEDGTQITHASQSKDAETISLVDQTSGSIVDGWKYFRGADENGNPAEIGSNGAIIGNEEFREKYPEFANKSISNQSLNVSNAHTDEAVQQRYSLESMVEETFLGNPSGQKAYKSFVELYLDFGQEKWRTTNYTKSLDMETGVVMVDYDYMGAHYTRETFASYPDQVVVTHIESTEDLNFSAQLHTYHNQEGYYSFEKVSDKEIKLTASVYNGTKNNDTPAGPNVIKFEARMLLDGDGVFTVSDDNTTISVNGGNEATIYIVGASNYVNYQYLDNSKPSADCEKYIANINSKTYDKIKARHLADFTEQFNSSSLEIENINNVDNYNVPTEQRIRKNIDGKSGFLTGSGSKLANANKNGVYSTYSDGDNELAVLDFNYGKYLTISGSRDERTAEECGADDIEIPMSQPLNLTGKWNAALSASWNGKYTININTEMNYWPSQPLGIADSEKPLINTFADLAQSGSITAANQYAIYNDRGDSEYQPGDPWVMHHNFDLWRGTQPIDNATAGLWPTGGVWLLDHAWQYYLFNLDKEYLAEVYPYMIGAAKFFTQFLVVDPQTGYLITAASCSPEQGGVQPGPAMDTQLIRNLYDTVLKASEILGKTEENATLIAKIKEQMPSSYLADEKGKIAPNVIDDGGLISEWVRGDVGFDFSEKSSNGKYTVTNPFKNNATVYINEHTASNNSGHRHCSNLWEMYPGTHLSAYSTDANDKAIYEAYKKSVAARGAGSGQGWGVAWRISLNARALEGDTASTLIEQLLTTRTSPNLFDQHPNFQIDGNYGITAGIVEMLLQSHDGNIAILPALPSRWQDGQFNDFKARGDVKVSAKWAEGKLTKAVLTPAHDGNLNVVVSDIADAVVKNGNGDIVETKVNGAVATFAANANESYTITYGDSEDEAMYLIESAIYGEDGLEVKYTNTSMLPNANAVLAVIQYTADGRLDIVKSYEINASGVVKTDIAAPLNGYVKVVIWDSITGMRAVSNAVKAPYLSVNEKPDFTAQPTIDPNATPTPSPTPTPVPTKPPMPESNEWYASDSDATLKSGYYVMKDMSLLFDVTSSGKSAQAIDGKTFTHYISSGDSGKWASGKGVGTAFKYDATESGTLTVYVIDLGAGKELCITMEGLKDNKENTEDSAYYKNLTGSKENKSISLDVKAGNTYYMYVAGSKGRFAGACFTPSGVSGTTTPNPSPDSTATPNPTDVPTPKPGFEDNAVYVGENKYTTINEALAAVAANAPTSEAERVYIDIVPGVYREQVVVDTPYVTMRKKADTDGDVLITWYYGLGSLYDSCNAKGYYDPGAIGDGLSYAPSDWGAALKVNKSAVAFEAENLTLENSYNRYYTEEELTDITGVDPNTGNSDFHRLEWINEQKANGVSDDEINKYLQSRDQITYKNVTSSPRERSCAFHSSADKVVVRNCEIISTQDTIGINTGRIYFDNCVLGGTTDYICGSSTAVFNNCELFTNAGGKGESATITAPSNPAESDGYLFYNCRVTGTKAATPGNFGRPWSGDNASANYINTTIDYVSGSTTKLLIGSSGWTSMSSNQPEDARFREYGSVTSDGKPVSTSDRPKVTLLNEWTMLRYNPLVFTRGTDGWDPAGLTDTYANVNGVIESTKIDTSNGSVSEIELPEAPEGYEFFWESDSDFATVSEDGDKITLIRPAAGEEAIEATVKLYAREKANSEIGAEKSIEFEIAPTTNTEDVFAVSGKVTLSVPSDTEQTINLEVKLGDAVIKTENVVVPAGETEVDYAIEGIPSGAYVVYPSTINSDYNIMTEPINVTGVQDQTVLYDIYVSKMKTVTAMNTDFAIEPTITAASGFSAGAYTATGSESANLGKGNTVYRLVKDEGAKVAKNIGVSFNLKDMLPSSSVLTNTKTLKFSFDFLMEKTDYMPSDYSYMDFATSTANAGNDAADDTRFARFGVHKSWGQFNFFNAVNARINGDNTQFDKNNAMANRWYRFVCDVDLEAKTIHVTVYDRDLDMYMLNKKPFTIAEPDDEGLNPNYPSAIDLSNLYFNFYMDKKANTTNKLEYYLDNITLEYQDYE